jgi:MinD-like ATPase involved in chromosome partitioning or flagellar assembly
MGADPEDVAAETWIRPKAPPRPDWRPAAPAATAPAATAPAATAPAAADESLPVWPAAERAVPVWAAADRPVPLWAAPEPAAEQPAPAQARPGAEQTVPAQARPAAEPAAPGWATAIPAAPPGPVPPALVARAPDPRPPAAGGTAAPARIRPDQLVRPRRRAPARGIRRLLFKATGGRINLGQSSAEQARLNLIERARTPAATGRRRVAFVSLKGGVGKTTTTVMLGHTLATHRGDSVIAIDANPDAGNLASRVLRQTPATARDLLRAAAALERYADVRAFTSQAESRLQVLAGESDPALSEAFGADDYTSVLGALERFYSVILTDCGTGILHDAMRAVLWHADQLVVITSPALDSAQALNQLLDWLDRHGYHPLVEASIVVVNAVRRDSDLAATQLVSQVGARCRSVVNIPYDRALSAGGEVELADLDPRTRHAYLELAAAVGDYFSNPRVERRP